MGAALTGMLRVVALLLMAAWGFFLYAAARASQEVVGLDFATVLASCSFALVLSAPLAWIVAVPETPRVVRACRDRRRWLQGRCPGCGAFVAYARGTACPECGADRARPRPSPLSAAMAKRLAALALAGWLLGAVAAEVWASWDEAHFARQAEAYVSASADTSYSRPRRWPMHDKMLYYTPADGVTPFSPWIILSE
jgi:hypothetical protein